MTIAAPKMAVRTHIPWYLRALFLIVVLSISLAFAAWIYDAGRRFAGFDRDEVQQRLAMYERGEAYVQPELTDSQPVQIATEPKPKIRTASETSSTRKSR